MTERFDSHRYAEALAKTGHYAREGGVLYKWTGTYWNAVSDTHAEQEAYDWIVDNDRAHALPENARKAVKAALLWLKELPTPTPDVVIPCTNGYVHASNGKLLIHPPDSKLGLRHLLACNFEPEAPPPERFSNFMKMILPDEAVRARVQEYAGYTLTADARHERAQLWLGSGANGKGVLAKVIQALHRRTEAAELNDLDGFNLSTLIGASLIYCDEVPMGSIDEDKLKKLISGAKVPVDRKYREPMSVCICGKWLALGNHLPTVKDKTDGFWRRWDIVPFDVTVPDRARDPLLADTIIKSELSGVLRWAVEGLARLQERGSFDPVLPKVMAELLEEAKGGADSIQAWYDDCGIFTGVKHCTSKDRVFSHYQHWCGRNELSARSAARFWAELKRIVPVKESRRRELGTQVRMCNLVLPPDGEGVTDSSLAMAEEV